MLIGVGLFVWFLTGVGLLCLPFMRSGVSVLRLLMGVGPVVQTFLWIAGNCVEAFAGFGAHSKV